MYKCGKCNELVMVFKNKAICGCGTRELTKAEKEFISERSGC